MCSDYVFKNQEKVLMTSLESRLCYILAWQNNNPWAPNRVCLTCFEYLKTS